MAIAIAYWGVIIAFLAGGISYALYRPKRIKGERPRLNMWIRAGIVLTLLWMPTGYLWRGDIAYRANMGEFNGAYQHCRDEQDQMLAVIPNPDSGQCLRQGMAWLHWVSRSTEGRKRATAIIPIFLGWILAFASLWATRWILAGRPRRLPHE